MANVVLTACQHQLLTFDGGRAGTPRSGQSSTYFYQFLVYDPLTEHPFHLPACLPQIEDVFEVQGVNDDEEDVNR
jgi:hypothetical protein